MNAQATAERRRRVRQLWGSPDRVIAQTLIEEGFTVEAERPEPIGKVQRSEWRASQLTSMRRNVARDREWWRSRWRKHATVPKGSDLNVAREEHVASLESDLEEIHELIYDAATKPTAKAMLIGERRQARALLAKARGVAEIAPTDPEADRTPPLVVGLLLGTAAVSDQIRGRLREQGVVIGDEDAPAE